MHVLTNGKVEISFDEQANPVSLRNLATGREWCSGNCGSLWRIIFEQGIVQEAEALPDRSRIEVEPEAGTLRIRYGGAAAENGTLDFRVEVVIRLDGEQVCFDARRPRSSPARSATASVIRTSPPCSTPPTPIIWHRTTKRSNSAVSTPA